MASPTRMYWRYHSLPLIQRYARHYDVMVWHTLLSITFKCSFLYENWYILIQITLKRVRHCSINDNPTLITMMIWCQVNDKLLSEPTWFCLLTHIWVTRPRCVNPVLAGKPLNVEHMLSTHIPPNAADMHQWIGSALVQIMACRLVGADTLSKPMLDYC